ncbi:MAG: hypothetical protein WDN45_06915 [Caulobacteraceae bacterium]
MKALIDQRAKLVAEMEALKNKIAGLDLAISLIQKGPLPAKGDLQPISRRSGVKGFVLDLLKERGGLGLNAAIAVEIAGRRGVLMDRGSVSSLLSRLKQEDIVAYDDNVYRLKEFAPELPTAEALDLYDDLIGAEAV